MSLVVVLEYREWFNLQKRFQHLQGAECLIPCDTIFPAYFGVPWRSTDKQSLVARILSMSRANIELFLPILSLLERTNVLIANGKDLGQKRVQYFP